MTEKERLIAQAEELFNVTATPYEGLKLRAFTKENPMNGFNGYVAIPPGHPLVVNKLISPEKDKWCDNLDIRVHGGVTFNERIDLRGNWKGWGIKKYEEGGIVIGFDTFHLYDTLQKWPRWKVREEAIRLKNQLQDLN